MGLNVFGSNPAGLTPFNEKQGGGDDYRLAEHIGANVIIAIAGPKEVTTQRYGVKTAISCDIVDLASDGTGKEYKDVLIFNAAPVDQLKGLAGQTIVATIGSYETKSGGSAPRFEAPSPEVVAVAEKYTAANSKTEAPF
jgi:hypothetical protein